MKEQTCSQKNIQPTILYCNSTRGTDSEEKVGGHGHGKKGLLSGYDC